MSRITSKTVLFIGLLIVLISLPFVTAIDNTNVLTNPGFESGTLPWTFYTNGVGSYTITADSTEGTSAAKITLTNPGTNTQLNQKGFTLKPSTKYTIKFSAKSSTGHDIQAFLHNDVSPYTSYGLSETFDLTTSYQTFTKNFTTPASVNTPRLRLWFIGKATAGDIYYFDGFELTETPPDNTITISNVQVSTTTNSAQINWNTNKAANSIVQYGLTSAYTTNISNLTEITSHSINIPVLNSSTTYHYKIISSNQNISASTTDATFTTATVQLPPPNNINITSDDFNYCTINPVWTFINPVGDGSYRVNGTNLLITVPQGKNHDVWTAGNKAARLMQNIDNSDFEIETKFESQVTNQNQLQGILIEQDTANFLRIDFFHDGATTRMFIAKFIDGIPTIINNSPINQNEIYIKVNRIGNNWKIYSSNNNIIWTQRADFSHTIITNNVGVFAGNAGLNPAHTASIDYFFNNNNRINPEDAQINTKTLTTNIIGLGAIIKVPDKATYACNDPVSLTASPDQGYSFSEWTGAATGNTNPTTIIMDTDKIITATFIQSNSTNTTQSNIMSDDFNYCIINPKWIFINPVGDGSYTLNGTNLLITVPKGKNHDVWNASNNASRLMQNINNVDFEIETKFESQVTNQSQLQGILIEQDTTNFLRIDFFHDGTTTRMFVAKFINGAPTIINNAPVAANSQYIKVTRTGNNWAIKYSTDGTSWNPVPSFNHPIITNKAGVYAGNAGPNPAHTAIVDYFFNTASRIALEDNKTTTKTLTTNIIGQGTINITPDKQIYTCNEKVNLTATPTNGSFFNKWSGSINTTINPIEIIMDADKNITATFAQTGSYNIYKEYYTIINLYNKDWRVTDPLATANATSGNNPSLYLPNSVLKINILDLDKAARAEAIIDLWGGHIGTTNKKFKFNANNWISVPELQTVSPSPQCYVQQWNPVIDIPLSNLKTGINDFEGTSGAQTCYSFNWGQWGWYGIIVRVYYDESKPHPTGQITSLTNGQTITDNPTITINASSSAGIKKVELLAYYDGYDEDGDGVYQDYHKSYHRGPSDTVIVLKNIAGSDTTAPYNIMWNTSWVPDQLNKSIKLKALITDNNGVIYETDAIENLTLQRDNIAVKLYKTINMRENFIVRDNKTLNLNFNIPLKDKLNNAIESQIYINSWNGNDAGINLANQTQFTKINSYTLPSIYGADHFYKFDIKSIPKWAFKWALMNGDNTLQFYSGSTEHGKEILWPGPAVAVRYNKPVYQQITSGKFEFDITLNASGQLRKDNTPAEVFIDLSALLAKLGKQGAVNKDSIMINEIDNKGNVIDDYIPFQFEPDIDYDQTEFAAGNLVITMKGPTAANAYRYYRVYFNINGQSNNISFPALVTVTDSYDEGQDSFMINTTKAVYQYHKYGAGLSSMIDNSGNDWISYNLVPGAAGTYRGIPNAVPPVANTLTPDGLFHPGYTNSVSNLISSGPIRTVIESISNDGKWKVRWEFYPEFAKMKMLRPFDNYWFLYEGTPGGSFEPNRDYMVLPDNVIKNVTQSWTNDIAGDWLYFADSNTNKALFLAHIPDDYIVDSYWPLNNSMTVFGFGRSGQGTKTYLSSKQEFTIGLLDTKTYNDVRDYTFSASKILNSSVGILRNSTRSEEPLVISDDFNSCNLGSNWQFINPLGDSSYAVNGENLIINVPGGVNHDVLSNNINAPRIMQNVSNPNFDVIVKFESNVSQMTQLQGILVEQDAKNFIRFNVYHDGSTPKIFAAKIVNGLWTEINNSEVSVQPNYLRIVRSGTNWELQHSQNGQSWNVLTSFSQLYNVTKIGVFAGNSNTSGLSPEFTSKIDYFFNANFPINPEDKDTITKTLTTNIMPIGKGTINKNPNKQEYSCNEQVTLTATPNSGWFFYKWTGENISTGTNPMIITMDNNKNFTATFTDNQQLNIIISNVLLSTTPSSAQINWSTDKASNSIVQYGLNSTYTASVADQTEVTSHSINIPALAQNTTYHYKIISNTYNESGNTDDATFKTTESSVMSDDFNYCTINPTWTFINPVGDGTYTLNGTNLLITVPQGTDHDIWAAGNRAARLMQNINNTDFEIETKFESQVTQKHQLQGVLIEQNTNNFIRIDFVNNGTNTMMFIATFTNGARKIINNAPVVENSQYIKVTRTGNNWVINHSIDGNTWNMAVSFNHTIITNKVGVYAGNSNSTGPSYEFTSIIDYFFNTALEITPEDNKTTTNTLTTNTIGQGTINKAPDKQIYSCNENVNLTATPVNGWFFDKWTGDINTTTNPINIIMNDNKNFTATFTHTFTISNISVSTTTNSAQINWSTEEPSNSIIQYGLTSSYTTNISNLTEVTSHSINIPALEANTIYHYKIISNNQNRNLSTEDEIFKTASINTNIVSDDFNTCTINPVWTFINPIGDGTYTINGTNLLITVPQGTNHDIWTAGNKAARLMQNINNTDFEIETKFESQVTQKHQMQGILIEQDTNNYIRTDFVYDGTKTIIFTAKFINGAPTIINNSLINQNEAYIKVNRTGNNWKISSSSDGNNWTQRADFSHTITANKAGVFAGNAGLNPAHTAIVDYFFNNNNRTNPEDANIMTKILTDNVIGQGTIIKVPDKATYTCNEQVTLTATPNQGYSFSEWTGAATGNNNPTSIVMDSDKTITATFIQSNSTNTTQSNIISDDFNTCTINPIWTFINPVGDGTYRVNGTNLLITVPQGTDHNLWIAGNRAARLMQNINNTDFEIETKFESQVTSKYQMQGILIEQDINNYIRTEFFHDGTDTIMFVTTFTNGIPRANAISNVPVASDSQYIKINRTGNNWKISSSSDGNNWTQRADFNHTITTNKAGVYAGNTGPNPAHTAIIDYFFNNNNRTNPEDQNAYPPTYLTINNDAYGTVNKTPDKIAYTCNEQVTLTATPNSGWFFNKWTGDINATTNPINIIMNTDKNISAIFTTITTTNIISDDFNTCTINPIWTFINPIGDGTYRVNGTNLLITVPQGTDHDIWTAGNRAPRLMQNINNADFEIETKFESQLTSKYQMQGILIEQDINNFIRTDYYTDGTTIRLFITTFTSGIPRANAIFNSQVIGNFIKINRTGNNWKISSSSDGNIWTQRADFNHTITTNKAGVFAGNAGPNPSHTAIIDYFFNNNNRTNPEDQNAYPPTYLTINNDPNGYVIKNPDKQFYTCNEEVSLNAISDNGYILSNWTVESAGSPTINTFTQNPLKIILNVNKTITPNFIPNTINISIWYGDTQNFGQVGNPTRWINILGNVYDPSGITSLSYTLNNKTRNLSIGPDTRRLGASGDFNIDINTTELNPGTNIVYVTAINTLGHTYTQNVLVNYNAGNVWPTTYNIDWNNAGNILDVSQVVDGKWQITNNGINIVEPNYDRLVAIGDISWTDYEITFPVTIHNIDTRGFSSFNSGYGAGLGLIMRWQGHTDNPAAGWQPKSGWRPFGAIGWYWWDSPGSARLQIHRETILPNGNVLIVNNQTLSTIPPLLNTTYMYKMRVVTVGGNSTYHMKVWQANDPEPAQWTLSSTETSPGLGSGSVVLLAHHINATFGNVQITPIEEIQNIVLSSQDESTSENTLLTSQDKGNSISRLSTMVSVQEPTEPSTETESYIVDESENNYHSS